MIQVTGDSEAIDAVLAQTKCEFPLSSLRHRGLDYFTSIHNAAFTNESFLILENQDPICLAVRMNLNGQVSFFGQPFRVEFAEAFFRKSDRTELDKAVIEAIWAQGEAAKRLDIEIPVACEATNNLVEALLPFADRHAYYLEGFVDLTSGPSALDSNLRKSHRREVRKANSTFENITTYFGHIDGDTFDTFRALHFSAAGRKTRSDESWEEQRKAIVDRRASLTTVVHGSEIIGATFSWLSPSSALYGTGAYDRSAFSSLSVSHGALFASIQHAQSLGVSRYILGEVFTPDGTQKEKNIAFFKRGFSKSRQHFHRLSIIRGT